MNELRLEDGDVRACIIALETVRDNMAKQPPSFLSQIAIEKMDEALRNIRQQLRSDFVET